VQSNYVRVTAFSKSRFELVRDKISPLWSVSPLFFFSIYNACGTFGWVSSWTDVRLTHWLHKFILVWPHQVN